MKMLLFSPIVLVLSAYMALVYGYLYLLFTNLTDVFQTIYHFPTSLVGLTYLGLGIGMVGGIAAYGSLSDKMTSSLASKAKGADGLPKPKPKPEHRLPPSSSAQHPSPLASSSTDGPPNKKSSGSCPS